MARRDLDHLELSRPCPATLPDLGAERAGWCATCGQTVHNLSAGTRAEAEALLASGKDLCVAWQRRRDGRMVFNLAVAGAALLAGCLPMGGKPPVDTLYDPSPPAERATHAAGFADDATLPRGTLRVAVGDDEGLAVPLVTVEVVASDPGTCPPAGAVAAASGQTDGDGRLELTNLPPGDYHILARRAGFADTHARVRLGEVGVAGRLTLTFPGGPIFVGGV